MKLTLLGNDPRGLTLRVQNDGMSPVAVIRSYRPGFYASHEVRIVDAAGNVLDENEIVRSCGTPYALTEDALVVVPPGESRELAVDTLGYRLAPGAYRVRVTYRTNRAWLDRVQNKPPGFEHLAEGEWTSNEVLTK
jgi:hypothetical protein